MCRSTLVAILVVLFAGCTSTRTEVVPEQPGQVRERLVALAIQEWRAFDGQIVRFDAGKERIDPVGLWEDTQAGGALVAKYWNAVGKPWDGADCDKPWSAAFVSWLMREAGVPRQAFAGGALHSEYLQAIADQSQDTARHFRLRDAADYSPKPGDLICAPRDGSKRARFDQIEPHSPMHCDLVIANADGILDSIGGNVRNSVSRTLRHVDQYGLATSATDRPWQLVVENLYP